MKSPDDIVDWSKLEFMTWDIVCASSCAAWGYDRGRGLWAGRAPLLVQKFTIDTNATNDWIKRRQGSEDKLTNVLLETEVVA